MDKQHIVDEIRRTAEANGGAPLGKARFLAETGIRESDWRGKYWVRWSDAVREAGFKPNVMQGAYQDEFLLEHLARFVRELGHYPTTAELRMRARQDADFPSHNTFSRWGRKADVASALMTWCESQGDWDDVVALCAPFAMQEVDNEADEDDAQPVEFGYVYMIRSGKYFKIGRSNAPGRRAYELAIQLPEPVSTVHTIKTDDPAGIERYWHERFADRRKNGEWFELSRDDVSAFRRRKFM